MKANEADLAGINAAYETWVNGVKAGDLELFLSVFTEDASRMQSEMPSISGKDQMRAYFKELFEQFNLDTDVYGDFEVEVANDWAFTRGNYILSLTPKDGGPSTHLDGKWLDILKKQTDGSWKVYIDHVSDNVPPKVE